MSRHDPTLVRRSTLFVAAVLFCISGSIAAAGPQDGAKAEVPRARFEFETVRRIAETLATNEFSDPNQAPLPPALEKLSYDEYRDVRFRPDHALWRDAGLPFTAQFFHRGYLYRPRVDVHVLTADGVADVRFDPTAFEYPKSATPDANAFPPNLGFAGFRLHAPINRPDYLDEVIAFLGASYFRPLAKGQVYGSSARGLAIDTAEPRGEEFPLFREFWIREPKAGDVGILLFALLDSKSVTGAFEIEVTPGETTLVRVHAEVFARREVKKLELAPLTSMFLFGENRTREVDDFRPEVHDCDGLLVCAAGRRIWRPLDNPPRTHRVSRFDGAGLSGFGLMQRDRRFDDYEDLESRFENRPSLWVEPHAGFDSGHVELVEIPTAQEVFDNVVAYFVPDRPMAVGDSRAFDYVLSATSSEPAGGPQLRVVSTRIHAGIEEETSLFVLEFAGDGPLADPLPEAKVTVGRGSVKNVVLQRNPVRGTLRLSFRVVTDGDEPTELRAELLHEGAAVSETWVHPWGES